MKAIGIICLGLALVVLTVITMQTDIEASCAAKGSYSFFFSDKILNCGEQS
jgi:hypothetical protein|tara:strand:+ start:249 stop:401 length:153 start_codon:yes stop_codon:yes gene_type:complete